MTFTAGLVIGFMIGAFVEAVWWSLVKLAAELERNGNHTHDD